MKQYPGYILTAYGKVGKKLWQNGSFLYFYVPLENGANTDRRVFWEGVEVSRGACASAASIVRMSGSPNLCHLASSDFCCSL